METDAPMRFFELDKTPMTALRFAMHRAHAYAFPEYQKEQCDIFHPKMAALVLAYGQLFLQAQTEADLHQVPSNAILRYCFDSKSASKAIFLRNVCIFLLLRRIGTL